MASVNRSGVKTSDMEGIAVIGVIGYAVYKTFTGLGNIGSSIGETLAHIGTRIDLTDPSNPLSPANPSSPLNLPARFNDQVSSIAANPVPSFFHAVNPVIGSDLEAISPLGLLDPNSPQRNQLAAAWNTVSSWL